MYQSSIILFFNIYEESKMNQRTNEIRVAMYQRFKHAINIPSNQYSRIAVNIVDYGFGCSVKLYDVKHASLVANNIKESSLAKDFEIATKMSSNNSLLFQLHHKSAEADIKPAVKLNSVVNSDIKKQVRNETRRYLRNLVNNILQLKTSEYAICDVYPSYENWIVVYYRYTTANAPYIRSKLDNSILANDVSFNLSDDKLQLTITNECYQQLRKQTSLPEVKVIKTPTQLALKSTGVPKVKDSVHIDTTNFIANLSKSMANGQIDAAKFAESSIEIFNVLNNNASMEDTIKVAKLMGKKVQIELV